jgi:hypothetical protein
MAAAHQAFPHFRRPATLDRLDRADGGSYRLVEARIRQRHGRVDDLGHGFEAMHRWAQAERIYREIGDEHGRAAARDHYLPSYIAHMGTGIFGPRDP